jgi:VanZ family protein
MVKTGLYKHGSLVTGILCLGLAAAYFLIGTWPMNYLQPNRVSWISDGGISFEGPGLVHGSIPADQELRTLEIMIRPSRPYGRRIPHLLSLADSKGNELFYIGQWQRGLVFRSVTPGSSPVVIRWDKAAANVLEEDKSILVTLMESGDEILLYLDGKHRVSYPGPGKDAGINNPDHGLLVLGNGPGGHTGWRGDIMGLALVNRVLDQNEINSRYQDWSGGSMDKLASLQGLTAIYTFTESKGPEAASSAGGRPLKITRRLTPVRPEILAWPTKDYIQSRSFKFDALVNLAGFIPMGLLLYFFLRSLRGTAFMLIFAATAAGLLLSLFIEINQVFLIWRSSSATDLILNTAGSLAGAFAAHLFSVLSKA